MMNPTQPEDYGQDDLLEQASRLVDEGFRTAERNGNAGRPFWTAGELLTTNFPNPVWVVPNLIPSGMTILAGRPKVGKSWLAMQIAIAAATGGMVFDEPVDKRRVLYLALEDSPRRLKDRLKSLCCPSNATIDFSPTWPTLLEDGLEELTRTILAGGYSLTVVDTLARWASVRKPDDEMTVAKRLGELQHFTGERNIAAMLIDHHRKPAAGASDLVNDIMGPTSKVAVADAALGLYRPRGKLGAELKLTGRDVTERELAVQFDPYLFCWQLLGNADDVMAETLQGQILAIIKSDFGGKATGTQVAKALGKDRGNVHREMQELVSKLRLVREDGQGGKEVFYKLVHP